MVSNFWTKIKEIYGSTVMLKIKLIKSHFATLDNDNGHTRLVAAIGGDVLDLAHD